MTTRTTLSAACPPWRATRGQPGEVFPAPWSSLASLVDGSFSRDTGRWSRTATFPWPPRPIRPGGRLIANLELESRLTYRKLSPLKISNRKFFAIFYLASHSALACPDEDHLRRRVAQFLIANARLEIPANHTKQSTATKSNRERIAIFQLVFRALATPHSRLATKSHGARVTGCSHESRPCSLRHIMQIRFSRIPALRYAAVTGHTEKRILRKK
jgi:hypothetical protein